MANKIKDLTGQKFGTLLVLQLDKQKSLPKRKYWKCKCLNCGKQISRRQDSLQKAKSCGCIKDFENSQYKDHTGEKFGKLTVMYITDRRNTQRRPYWHCKCDCGNELDVIIIDLQSGHTTSCGCNNSKGEMIISQILRENNIPFIQQKTFDSCRFKDTNQLAKFDFYVNNQYLIEFDGIQHFQYSGSGWDKKEIFEKTKIHDDYKTNWCKENNIPLIRIPYTKLKTLELNDLLIKDEFKA